MSQDTTPSTWAGKTIKDLSREDKDYLKGLSKEVFGASSRWQKLVERGYGELVTEETTEYVPNEKDPEAEGTTRKVQVPVLYKGMKHSVITRHTVESIRTYMLERKVRLDEIRAMIAKQRADAQAKKEREEEQQRILSEASGSALSP